MARTRNLVYAYCFLLLSHALYAQCPFVPSTVFYLNGILTDDKGADDDRAALDKSLRQLLVHKYGQLTDSCLQTQVAYNPTAGLIADLDESLQQVCDAGQNPTPGHSSLDWLLSLLGLGPGSNSNPCYTIKSLNKLRDKFTISGLGADTINTISLHIAQYQRHIRVLNRDVIIVSHSQGNLFANLEYTDSRLTDSDRNRLHIVAVSTPADHVAGYNSGADRYVTLAEDIVAADIFPDGHLPPNSKNPSCAVIPETLRSLRPDWCHLFESAYLDNPDSNAIILAFTATLLRQLPTVNFISPTSIPVGTFTLAIQGSNFAVGASVAFGGILLPTTFISPSRLTATGIATLSQVGSVAVTVIDPGSVSSNSLNVTVVNVSGGGAGSTAIITGVVNGQTVDKAYVPISAGRIAVINADSNTSTGALVKAINMPAGYHPNATAANPATGQVAVVSYTSPDVQIIDASQDLLAATMTAPVMRTATFSGGSCMICGVLIDVSTNSAILDTAQGYMLLDLATRQFSFLSGTVAGENFGFNPNTRIVLNPTYNQGVPAGLQAVAVGGGPVFTYMSSVGGVPDATAVDINTNIALVPDEFTGNQYLVNMAAAIFNPSGSPPQFTAPSTIFPITFTACGGELHDWSLVSVESSRHLGFIATEFADCAAVESLPTSIISGAPPIPSVFYWGHMPSPDGIAWNNGGDPHGIAVFTSVVNGNPYGFLIRNDQAWVARIDLAGLKSAPLLVGGLTNQVNLTPFVFFLKTQ